MSSTGSSQTPHLPLIAWQRLRAGNERFHMPICGDDRCGNAIEERPIAAVLRCSDTAVSNEVVFGQSYGSLIDVSTWGHAVDRTVISTLEYAVETCGAPLIVVLGHPNCPAMRTAMRAWKEATIPDGATRTVVEAAIGSIVRRGVSADSVEEVTSAHVVETGLALLERSPVIARRVNAGQCAIICATTDPADGRVVVHATVGAVGEVDGALLECV